MKTNAQRWTTICGKIGVAVLFLIASCNQAGAWTEDIKSAAKTLESGGKSSPEVERLIFENNQTLNRMAARGTANGGISQESYVASQRAFSSRNNAIIRDAARECGLVVDIKESARDPLAGADTDVNFSSRDNKPVTYEQWQKFNETYQNKVNEYLGRPKGAKVETATDLMPDPRSTSPDEFRKITKALNERGGTAYSDMAAVRVESAMAGGRPIAVEDVGGYVSELQGQARSHFEQAARTTGEANALAKALGENHPSVQDLRAKAQIENSQGAKYINKIEECGARLRGPSEGAASQGGQPPASELTRALRDARGADTIAQSERIRGLSESALNNATRNTIQDLVRTAKVNPDAAPACQQAIAESLRDLPMNQKGQMMEMVESSAGKEFSQGVVKASQTVTPGARIMGGFNSAMKVIGPGLMIYDGYNRIRSALDAPDEAKTYVAGSAAGGFIGGVSGAAALGLGTMAIIGAPVTAVGAAAAIGVTVAAGAVGYGVGDYAGTQAAGWALEGVRPKDQSEYDAAAAKNLGAGAQNTYQQLINAGVPADIAQAAADAYKRGDLQTFNKILSEVRKVLVANAKNMPPRRFEELGDSELQKLLNCLCSASLGANPWVYQGYNTTPSHGLSPSCDNLGNGPCMAQGFGCWRSFIRWGNPGIADCLAAFNLPTNSRALLGQIDRAHQAQFEEPFSMEMKIEPMEVCPGDKVTVTVSCKGGRGNYQYTYHGGWPFIAPEDAPGGNTPTTAGSMTFTVDPTLRRGFFNGQWEYTRPLEGYDIPVWVKATTTEWDPVDGAERTAAKALHYAVRLRPHDDCEKTAVSKPATAPKPGTAKTTTAKPSAQVSSKAPTPSSGDGATVTAGGGTSKTTPGTRSRKPPDEQSDSADGPKDVPSSKTKTEKEASLPVTKSAVSREPQDESEQEDEAPEEEVSPECAECLSIGGAMRASASEVMDASGMATRSRSGTQYYWVEGCPGQTVRITLEGSDGFKAVATGETHAEVSRPVGTESGTDTIFVENLGLPDCSRTVSMSFGPPEQIKEESPIPVCDECLEIGGGMEASASGVTLATGEEASSYSATMAYYVQGCGSQNMRISVNGSDGWQGSAQGAGRAEIKRPIGKESGTDEITVENLGIPGCKRTFRMPFQPPSDLRDAESPAESLSDVQGRGSALGSFVGAKEEKMDVKTGAGLSVMGAQTDLQQASTAGEQSLREAKATRDAGGQEASSISQTGQQAVRVETLKQGNQFVDAIIQGVGSGVSQAGATFGAGAGEHVAGDIFDRKSRKVESTPEPVKGVENAAPSRPAQTKSASDGGHKTKSAPPTAPTPAKTTSGQMPAQETILVDALCPVCGKMYNPAQGHQCPGAPKPAEKMCQMCGKQPGTSVTTVEGHTLIMCASCQGEFRCSVCGRVAESIGGAAYNYTINGVNHQATIRNACSVCIEKWKKEHADYQ